MINWKRVLPWTMGLVLSFQSVAYASLIVPPAPIGAETQAGAQSGQSGAAGPETAQAGGSAAQSIAQPEVAAEGAVLMDGATGKVLFGKNENQQFFPASITKVMTALLTLERCNLNDVVTFSATATTNLEYGAVALGVSEGDQLTVEQALHGLLLKSANEIGNGLAEHIAGSVSGFADLMNEKARSLGCKNTHFANPHGLNDPDHLTTPYDMALIMRAALQNADFCRIDTTTSYSFPALKKEPAKTITMGHKMMYPTDSRYYAGIIGGKTGYTSKAGNTLVTGVERDGVRLIAVVMKSKQTHYADTKAMLDYGFANYQTLMGTAQGGSEVQAGNGGQAGNENAAGNTVTAGASGGTNALEGPGGSTAGTAQVASSTTSAAAQTANGTTSAVTQAVPGTAAGPGEAAQAQEPGWHQDGQRWYYVADGKKVSNAWQTIDGLDYWFDGDGYMATGWRQYSNGAWYYFKPSIGYMMKNCWIEDGGNWYYLGADGALLTNTTTPDGYPVDENGIWQH